MGIINQTDGEELALVLNGGQVMNEVLEALADLDHAVESQKTSPEVISCPPYHFHPVLLNSLL